MLDSQTSVPERSTAAGRGTPESPASRLIPQPSSAGQGVLPTIEPPEYLSDFASPRPRIRQTPLQFHVVMAPLGDPHARHGATDRMKSLRPFIKALAFALALLLPMSVAADWGKPEQTTPAVSIRGMPMHVDRFSISRP